ncbi:MAG TPA: tRNA (adenosine(37)-N6)-threonylcarbamoyltransferase complex dimerization subunit type 1 TsaB, partial [Gammaproteobacteria bacterium]|nr:tRNA (adenosine(37)-N6)-threonylcarbamoyltransferase complex dimerization subunit type 1 TsaB [Gammaproteobacteria bacterium]
MRVLALDTATEACSVALWLDGSILERHEIAPRGHADRVLAMMEAVLAEAGVALRELDGLGFGRGPGAFTGVRIAAGVAQGAAFGADLPVVPVSTLATLARGVQAEGTAERVLAAIDARKGEVYWGAYGRGPDGGTVSVVEECVAPPGQVPIPDGAGW